MDKRKGRMDKHAVALGLARMWGVMETLEDIGSASQQEVCDTVTAWAEEFITGGQSDLVDFFDRKAKAVKKGRKPDGGGCVEDDDPGTGYDENSLLEKIYKRVAYWENDARDLDVEYDEIVERLLEPLKETMDEAAVEKVSETIYSAAYPAGRNGFLLGMRFAARLLSEMWTRR